MNFVFGQFFRKTLGFSETEVYVIALLTDSLFVAVFSFMAIVNLVRWCKGILGFEQRLYDMLWCSILSLLMFCDFIKTWKEMRS
jgi:hypothetical protein